MTGLSFLNKNVKTGHLSGGTGTSGSRGVSLSLNIWMIKFCPGKLALYGPKSEAWKARGLICGVEWPVFRGVIEKYRQFLMEHYGGAAEVRKQLVFAHNDVRGYCAK